TSSLTGASLAADGSSRLSRRSRAASPRLDRPTPLRARHAVGQRAGGRLPAALLALAVASRPERAERRLSQGIARSDLAARRVPRTQSVDLLFPQYPPIGRSHCTACRGPPLPAAAASRALAWGR